MVDDDNAVSVMEENVDASTSLLGLLRGAYREGTRFSADSGAYEKEKGEGGVAKDSRKKVRRYRSSRSSRAPSTAVDKNGEKS